MLSLSLFMCRYILFYSYLTNFHATNILSLTLKPISCTFKTETDRNWLTFSIFNFQHNHHKCPSGLMTYKADIEHWISSSHFKIQCLISPDSSSQVRCRPLCTIWSSHEFSRPMLHSVLLCTLSPGPEETLLHFNPSL